MPPPPPDPAPPAPRPARPAGVRFVANQIVEPAPGDGRVEFSIPNPVVLGDGAPVSVYVRGVAVASDGYEIAVDVGTGDGITLTLRDAPSTGDLVTVSGFCRENP